MIRIAYITTGYPYVSHTFIQREVQALRQLGAEIHTFAVRASDPADLKSADDVSEFERTYAVRTVSLRGLIRAHLSALGRHPSRWLSTLRWSWSLGTGLRGKLWQVFYFVQAVLLWQQVRSRQISHIHAHFANVSSDLAMLATSMGGVGWSWSFTMHGPTEFSDVTLFNLRVKAESATFVVCISDFCRSQLMALCDQSGWEKFHVVHCGVDADRFKPVTREFDGKLRVLCLARLSSVKGHLILLDAIARLRADGLNVHLTLVGDGPMRQSLERHVRVLQISDCVSFEGALGQDQVREHFDAADIFALASFSEGVPVVLMEAMASGLPVVATRIAGIGELIEDGRSGFLVAPGRSDLVATALRFLATDPAMRQQMGQEGRVNVIRDYAIDEAGRLLDHLFKRYAVSG